MSNTDKLIFFNKDGYPYNFRLNDGIWTGKIFFEQNSTDIFKSLSIYTLESVDSIEYSNTMDIINKEIYNTNGMIISKKVNGEDIVNDIKPVNKNSNFYSKWIIGDNFHRKYPVGSTVSFISNIISGTTSGQTDFIDTNYYSVVKTKKNGVMIITDTSNISFNFIYDKLTNPIYIKSNNNISITDIGLNYINEFDIGEKVSIVGTVYNDGVNEVVDKSYNVSTILDFDLGAYSLQDGDKINIDLELFTDKPLIYNGNINLEYDINLGLIITFLNNNNSNIITGEKFVIEDLNGNNLTGGNIYTINNSINTKYIGSSNVIFTEYEYEEDDGKKESIYKIQVPKHFNIKLNDIIKFDLHETYSEVGLNGDLVRKVIRVETGTTLNTYTLDGHVHEESLVNYNIYKMLRDYEINQYLVTSSIDYTLYNGYALCLSSDNKISYEQNISINGYTEAIDNFIDNYYNYFYTNGIQIYRIDNILYFHGIFNGKNKYFDIKIKKNGIVDISKLQTYLNVSGTTNMCNFILQDNLNRNEVINISNQSVSYYADIILDIFDDSQDFGFQLTINSVQYYIPFNDNSGTTSYTLETIKDFINLYGVVFNKLGLNLNYGTTTSGSTTLNHLYINGVEPNVDIWEIKVKVNKNSSYKLVETKNKYTMITSNKLLCYGCNFINLGYSTGMIISVSGSNYPSNNKEFNIIGIDNNQIELSYQGTMYSDTSLINIKSREYLRRPRESNLTDIYYRFRWDDDEDDSIFLYDLSGDNLVPYGNNPDYAYIGPKPLCNNNDLIILNKDVNRNKNYVKVPYKQKTVFDQLDFKLDRIDDDNISILPKPIETFIGYNSKNEGVNQRNLIIERLDNVRYNGFADGTNIYFTVENNTLTINGTSSDSINFLEMGFRTNRYLRMKFEDSKPYSQKLFENYNDYYILEVSKKKIKFKESLINFSTENEEFQFDILLLPEKIASIVIYGQTEEEDERYESNLKLLGIDLTEEDEFIFKESNVLEDGIDYRLLNRKRKEMLNIYPEIYNYIGSYKAILNSIDFFGYNDVDLMEYYKNINENSPYYRKLKRVLIPDILERKGDDFIYEPDVIKRTEYVKTNLFNLTYRITDEEGNNLNLYTLKDVQFKLNGLKNWLRKNVIPINSNIRDITGISECVGTLWTRFDPCVNIFKNVVKEDGLCVNFNYSATRNFNDSWLISVKFYTTSDIVPEWYDLKVTTYSKDINGKLNEQQNYEIFKTDLNNFNFSINWTDDNYDQFFSVKTTTYGENGISKTISKMYRLEDGTTYYFDEFKNYVLVNNVFKYKYYDYVQNQNNVYIIDEYGNIYIIDKDIYL